MEFLKKATQRDEYLISLNAVEGKQFGKKVYSAQVNVSAALKIFQVDEEVQRELDSERIGGLVNYIVDGIGNAEKPFYFPPFIFSARKNGKYKTEEMTYSLKSDHKMVVLDGQHRLRALERAEKYLKTHDEEMHKELINYPLSLQIYYDLSFEQERQLFSDVNSKAARVGANLIKMYSLEDPTTLLMREIIYNHPVINVEDFEIRRNQTRTKFMLALTLYKIIAMLDSGRQLSNQEAYKVQAKDVEELKEKVEKLLTLIHTYAPYNARNRSNSIYLNQSVILSVAKVASEIPEHKWESVLFKKIIAKYNWDQSNRELASYGVAYNAANGNYRLTPPNLVFKSMYTILKNKCKEEVL